MAKKLSAFEQAFADARNNGEKTFPFNGKTYSTTTMDDVQKKIDAMPSMNRTTGVTVTTQGATYPKASTDEKELSDMAKGFRAAREKFGDTPFVDALMNAGKAGIAIEGGKIFGPAGSAISSTAKKVFSSDAPAVSKDVDPELFTPGMKRPDSLFGEASARDFKKGGEAKKYAKGGKISLNACGVSTHTPGKKNPNF